MPKVDQLLSEMELFDEDPTSELEEDVKKKKKKKKKDKKDKKSEGASERNNDDDVVVPEKTKKKKKRKKKTGEDSSESHPDSSYVSPETVGKKHATLDPSRISPVGVSAGILTSPGSNERNTFTLSSKENDKWGVEYFEALLEEIRGKCERKLKIKDNYKDDFISLCNDFYDSWAEKQENDLWLMDLVEGNNPHKHETEDQTTEELIEAQIDYGKELDAAMIQQKRGCIKSALSVFMGLKEDSLTRIQEIFVKGSIISQATPKKLADFASKGKQNKKLLKRLFGDTRLMKEMLHHGGAMKYEYGEAIRIFVDCMEVNKSSKKNGSDEKERDDDDVEYDDDFDNDEWSNVYRKIALACALELASPMYEFDTSKTVDPVARYKHFVDAYRAGELDAAFPYFSVWEMRQIVNCDAPNDQMSWCRKMVMNYVPHLTCLTDVNLRYVYLLHSDVRNRKPTWTASPRTYPMVLSGGGNESVNSWFGRFMLKSFGLPSWGSKFRRKEGYTSWTPDGWVALNGADWDNCSWRGKTGKDFKTEVEARNKAPPEEYFKRLLTLQCLADIVDGDPNQIPEGEKDVLHPERMWRSMAIVSMELLFQTEPEVVRTFKREFTGTGPPLVVTNGEKYLEKFQENAIEAEIEYSKKHDELVIPASRHGFVSGTTVVIESFDGGKQVNFVADGDIEYEIPYNVPSKTYNLSFDVCTVSSKQVPLMVKIGDDMEPIEVRIPYTRGEWQKTDGVPINIEAGAILRFSRPKGSLGLAVKNFVFAAP